MVKMMFPTFMYYNSVDTPLYAPGVVYEVEDRMVARWQKRGGWIVEDTPETKVEDGGEKLEETKPAKTTAKTSTKRK